MFNLLNGGDNFASDWNTFFLSQPGTLITGSFYGQIVSSIARQLNTPKFMINRECSKTKLIDNL